MVNKNNDDANQDELEITDDTDNQPMEEPELVETEEKIDDVIKKLRSKVKEAEARQRQSQEELQRNRADFLNAKRRLEEDRLRDKERSVEQMIERLLPLCDSFHLAMHDQESWGKADPVWRKGIEGIYAQLGSILSQYSVSEINPLKEAFDPIKHEALSTEMTTNEDEHNKIVAVMQLGYERTVDGKTNVVRPARVVVAEYNNN